MWKFSYRLDNREPILPAQIHRIVPRLGGAQPNICSGVGLRVRL